MPIPNGKAETLQREFLTIRAKLIELAAALERAAATRGRFVLVDVVMERGHMSGTLSRYVEGFQRRRAESG